MLGCGASILGEVQTPAGCVLAAALAALAGAGAGAGPDHPELSPTPLTAHIHWPITRHVLAKTPPGIPDRAADSHKCLVDYG